MLDVNLFTRPLHINEEFKIETHQHCYPVLQRRRERRRTLFSGKVKSIFDELQGYSYEHIFIDNASKDRTVSILKEIAKKDKNVKIIVNARNFGHIRSPYHAILQASGDAIISIVADLQDPPSMIRDFIKKWEEGFKIVIGVKTKSEENPVMFAIGKLYYNLIEKYADTEQIKNFTGFGLYKGVEKGGLFFNKNICLNNKKPV
jgi:glycosyltransferase involved in cell wall biosynthesis